MLVRSRGGAKRSKGEEAEQGGEPRACFVGPPMKSVTVRPVGIQHARHPGCPSARAESATCQSSVGRPTWHEAEKRGREPRLRRLPSSARKEERASGRLSETRAPGRAFSAARSHSMRPMGPVTESYGRTSSSMHCRAFSRITCAGGPGGERGTLSVGAGSIVL